MKKKIIKRRSYKDKIGEMVYFTDYESGVKSGKLVKVTPKFCNIEVNGKTQRKAKQNVYFSADDLQLKVIQESNEFLIEKFGINIFKMMDMLNDMSNKYPENFV